MYIYITEKNKERTNLSTKKKYYKFIKINIRYKMMKMTDFDTSFYFVL